MNQTLLCRGVFTLECEHVAPSSGRLCHLTRLPVSLQVLPTSTTGACWERGTARWRWSWRTRRRWRRWWTGRSIKLENTPCSSASSVSSTELCHFIFTCSSDASVYGSFLCEVLEKTPLLSGSLLHFIILSVNFIISSASCSRSQFPAAFSVSLFFCLYLFLHVRHSLPALSPFLSQDHFRRSHGSLHRRVGSRQRSVLQGGLDGNLRPQCHHLPEGETDISNSDFRCYVRLLFAPSV